MTYNRKSKYVNMDAPQEIADRMQKEWDEKALNAAKNGRDLYKISAQRFPNGKAWTNVKPGDIITISAENCYSMVREKPQAYDYVEDTPNIKFVVKNIAGTGTVMFVETMSGDILTSSPLREKYVEILKDLKFQKEAAERVEQLKQLEKAARESGKFDKTNTIILCKQMMVSCELRYWADVMPKISDKAKELFDFYSERAKQNNEPVILSADDIRKIRSDLNQVYYSYLHDLEMKDKEKIAKEFLNTDKKIIFVNGAKTEFIDSKNRFISPDKLKKGTLISMVSLGIDLRPKTTADAHVEKINTDVIILKSQSQKNNLGAVDFIIETPDAVYTNRKDLAKYFYDKIHPEIADDRKRNYETHSQESKLTGFFSRYIHGEISPPAPSLLDTYEPMSEEAQQKWEAQRQRHWDTRAAYNQSVFTKCLEEGIPVIMAPYDLANIGMSTATQLEQSQHIPQCGETIWLPDNTYQYGDNQDMSGKATVVFASHYEKEDNFYEYMLLTDDGLVCSSSCQKDLEVAIQNFEQSHNIETQGQELEYDENEITQGFEGR